MHTEAILAEVTMSMTKNTMVRGKKGKKVGVLVAEMVMHPCSLASCYAYASFSFWKGQLTLLDLQVFCFSFR